MSATPETADAVVVGARCAGSATATALARAGRRVVCIERARFPADTLSTHLLFLGGVVELQRLGALERVLALGAPKLPQAMMAWGPHEIRTGYTPVEGLDYALCVRRPGHHRLRQLRRPEREHALERAESLQLDDAAEEEQMGRERVGGELRPLDADDAAPGPGQRRRRRRAGAAGANDDCVRPLLGRAQASTSRAFGLPCL